MEEETEISPISDYNGEEVDRLSNLPESLIHHILSFIDMKYSVQTSVLSKRWRYIWTLLRTLSMHYDYSTHRKLHSDVDDYMYFVERVLMLRDNTCDIQNFHLICHEDVEDFTEINFPLETWMLGVIRRKIQDLLLDLPLPQESNLPPCIFTCKTLTKLVLYCDSYKQTMVTLPNSFDLPNLRSLKLKWVAICDTDLTNKFLSSCPVLESLAITRSFVNLTDINSPKLKYLTLKHNEYTAIGGQNVRFYAPLLKSFICESDMKHEFDYALENISSLVTCDITMAVDWIDKEEEPGAFEKFTAEDKVMSDVPELLDRHTFEYSNLRSLTLRPFLSKECLPTITYLLKISPNIESLCVVINESPFDDGPPKYPLCDEINEDSPDISDDWETGLSLPCFLYDLKTVTVHNVKGRINELKFLEILLKNAMGLEKLVLYGYWDKDPGNMAMTRRMKKFSEKLIESPRASPYVTFMCF
ncbi:putative F-box/FBD/LRR-repeat protein At1g78760 isoform X2 [Papaver somniferum]|uniref:putative F-box/FBD/LRR-repeat protein At1g78760 isoform X2 n=1 Tax=Papaver somniferum TaxID=3469 RepID=UPI000E6F7C0C|nr:putative F-box/FBD/LRR-repeat protein At1g78760 isoform X2 [Papaver somniferum]